MTKVSLNSKCFVCGVSFFRFEKPDPLTIVVCGESCKRKLMKSKKRTGKYMRSPGFGASSFYVYLFYSPVSDLYKIGVSGRVHLRRKNIEMIGGIQVEIVDFWEFDDASYAYTTETALHHHFSRRKSFGEWFQFHDMTEEEVRSSVEQFINGNGF